MMGDAWRFFALVYALTVPWWLLALFVQGNGLPDNLPLTDAGATFMPMLAAVVLEGRRHGKAGVAILLKRLFDWHRIERRRWLAVAVWLMPLLYMMTYAVMRALAMPVPDRWDPQPYLPVVFAAFFLAAAGEEYGYTAYATVALQQRYSALVTAALIGVPWAVWHLPSMIQLGQAPGLIASGLAVTVAYRVIYVWLFNSSGGSLFVVTLFHAIANTGRTAFPGGRPAFELGHAAVGYGMVAGVAVAAALLGRMATPPVHAPSNGSHASQK